MERFVLDVLKMSKRELIRAYNFYYDKRQHGDRTYRTLCKIQILCNKLMEKGLR